MIPQYGPIQDFMSEFHPDAVAPDGRAATLFVTGEFYFGYQGYVDETPFVWSFPKDADDRANMRFCVQTGFWVAGHDVVNVDGLDFASEFAPERVKRADY
jgi:hypothetical protein